MEFKLYPGLVGGHCIGVDPYYLSYKSKMLDIIQKLSLLVEKLMTIIINILVIKFINY